MTRFLGSSRPKGQEPALAGGRVYLRAPERRDRDSWIELREASREFLEPWEPSWSEEALTPSGFRRRLNRQLREEEEDLGYGFFIFRREDDALLGGITLSRVQRGVAQSCTIGYWTGAPYTRQGYMTEGLRCLLPHCFGPLELHRIEAACLPDNEASRCLLEKCGFRREGFARRCLRINGEWRDHLLYALLAEDYRDGSALRPEDSIQED